jgi:hypothetical protein
LYKYFAPADFSTTGAAFPDTVLTAHAQLVYVAHCLFFINGADSKYRAWRLNCQRAMVSLIDRDIQYFVAESTKTLHLDDRYE